MKMVATVELRLTSTTACGERGVQTQKGDASLSIAVKSGTLAAVVVMSSGYSWVSWGRPEGTG